MSEYLFLQTLINGFSLGLIYALMAMGLSIAFGVMHIINVAHGEFLILGAFIAFYMWSYLLSFGWMNLLFVIPAIVLLVVLVNGVIGYLLQRYVVNRIVSGPPLVTLLFFFGLAIALPNIYILIWGPYNKSIIDPSLAQSIYFYGISLSLAKIIAIVISTISIGVTLYLMYRTKLGLAIRGTAQNREAAQMFGVNIQHIYSIALAISLSLSGLSGALIAFITAFTPVQGPIYTLLTFLIVVMGGMGYVMGSIVAGILMGLLQAFVSVYLGTPYVYALMFLVLYLILLISPRGILLRGV